MAAGFDGLLWFALALLVLNYLQRLLHSEIQIILLHLTRSPKWSILLFSFLFLPGVLLHEASHYLMAKLLRVRTGRFSILPRLLNDSRIRLGYVEVGQADTLRSTLIGMAPLLAGLTFTFLVTRLMNLAPLWSVLRDGKWGLFWFGLQLVPRIPNFWLWFYLTLVITSTMMPSPSDRHGWDGMILLIVVLAGLVILSGGGPWLFQNILLPLNDFLRGTSILLLLSIALHFLASFPLHLLRRLLGW